MDKAILSRVGKQAWFHRYPRIVPLGIFALVALFTLLAVMQIERAQADRRRLELDRNATEVSAALQRRAAENMAYLRAAASLFAARDDVGLAEFEKLSTGVLPDPDRQGSLGMGWTPRVLPAGLAAFEARMRARGNPSFAVRPRPAGDGHDLFPITYLVPADAPNTAALGFDMASETTRWQAMQKAARLDRPTVSGRVLLVQNTASDHRPGFLIYMPVNAARDGKDALRGFVYSPFRAEDFLTAASELYVARGVNVALYDEYRAPDRLLAARSGAGSGGVSLEKSMTVGGRRWVLVVSDAAPSSFSQLSLAVLLAGLVIALLLTYIARLIVRRAAEDRAVLEWLTRQSEIRTTLTRELNHRVKNTLATVLSIVALTRRRSDTLDDFVESLTGRVRALSATHDLLTRVEWGATPIREVVASELSPYMEDVENHVDAQGPDIELAPNDALSLGLALHELATNAAKYGALSTLEGKVLVQWRLVTPALAELSWEERGGPTVNQPTKRGFGRELIERIVAHEMKTDVDLSFPPAGVRCTLRIPVRAARSEFALRERK
ncbi:MAG: CHASE domain-containing protein [Sphingomonadales bacterium]|nr:CHASE domain-containing protein [Sphingomonadales bacterium]